MIPENWKALEQMLEKIVANCMGEAMYNGLKEHLNGKTLIIEIQDGTNGGFGGSGIKIGSQMESNKLFQ